jgi:hypothetical protein
MAKLTRHTKETVQDFAIGDNASADSRSQRKQNQILNVLSSTHPHLSECSRIRVVLKNDRRSQPLLNFITDRESLETGQVRRSKHESSLNIDETRNANTHSAQTRSTDASANALDYVRDVFDYALRTGLKVHRRGYSVKNQPFPIDSRGT